MKNRNERENGKRILGLMTNGKRECIFLAKGVAKMYGCRAAEKKKIEETFQKLDANYFCQRKLFWDTPVYHVYE